MKQNKTHKKNGSSANKKINVFCSTILLFVANARFDLKSEIFYLKKIDYLVCLSTCHRQMVDQRAMICNQFARCMYINRRCFSISIMHFTVNSANGMHLNHMQFEFNCTFPSIDIKLVTVNRFLVDAIFFLLLLCTH